MKQRRLPFSALILFFTNEFIDDSLTIRRRPSSQKNESDQMELPTPAAGVGIPLTGLKKTH